MSYQWGKVNTFWVVILVLPVVTGALFIGLALLGLLARLFGRWRKFPALGSEIMIRHLPVVIAVLSTACFSSIACAQGQMKVSMLDETDMIPTAVLSDMQVGTVDKVNSQRLLPVIHGPTYYPSRQSAPLNSDGKLIRAPNDGFYLHKSGATK
jgi:hypothetical protein